MGFPTVGTCDSGLHAETVYALHPKSKSGKSPVFEVKGTIAGTIRKIVR